MSVENTITMPLQCRIEKFDCTYFDPRTFYPNLGRQISHEWELDNINVSSTMLPSTSNVQTPVSTIGQPVNFIKKIAETLENQNTTENENDYLASHKWYSEYEEMKNIQKKKVNIFFLLKLLLKSSHLDIYYE